MNSEVIVVSGLPRSGTSMMMRMLEAGGIEAVTDNVRTADEDNPKGYYEFERVKQLPEDTGWLPDAEGKVVKMVFTLLKDLPTDRRYKVIFMRRNIEEILASQKKMLERNEKENPVEDAEIKEAFEMMLDQIMKWLESQQHIDVEYVWYHDVVEQGKQTAEQVAAFIGQEMDIAAMSGVVDQGLYRNRVEEPED